MVSEQSEQSEQFFLFHTHTRTRTRMRELNRKKPSDCSDCSGEWNGNQKNGTGKMKTQTAEKPKPKTKSPLHGPGWCHICARYTGRKLTLSKFFRGGSIPAWAIVHPSCNHREKPAQFRERLQRWLADRTGQAVAGHQSHADAREQAETINETSGGSGPQTGREEPPPTGRG